VKTKTKSSKIQNGQIQKPLANPVFLKYEEVPDE